MASMDNHVVNEEFKMLTFSLDNVFYGVDVNQVREVKNFEGATPVPCAPNYVKGVTNLRGEVVPVIDLRKRIGLSPRKENDPGIMVVMEDKHPVGVIVDSVIEVLTLQKKDVETGPNSLIAGRTDGVIGIAKHEENLIVMLDIIKVLATDNLNNINENVKGFQIQVQKATQ